MQVELGSLVGYKVRFEEVAGDKTKVLYLTDGMLLREAMLGKNNIMEIMLKVSHRLVTFTDATVCLSVSSMYDT